MNYAEFKERERKVIAFTKKLRSATRVLRNYLLWQRLARLREKYAADNKENTKEGGNNV